MIKYRNAQLSGLLALSLLACGSPTGNNDQAHNARGAPEQPNILIIVADDMGFTDLGVYGSEIATPHIDQLAKDGLILTDFHNQAVCAPTRAALLAGTDEHNAGGTMHQTPNQRGVAGYENELSADVVTFPAMLQEAGYKTYWAGKWHLGSGQGQRPVERGFDRAFTLISSGASHFSDMRGMFSREKLGHYSFDGQDVTNLPDDFYSTVNYTDAIIDFMDEDAAAGSGAPWFAFLGFTAPHWPLHAPDANIAKFEGMYDSGYEVLRTDRIERAKSLGIIAQDAPTYKRLDSVAPWDSLSANEKAISSKEMEVYAGMIDSIDENVGRLIGHLKETGQYDNTYIMFISDNGAEGQNRDPGADPSDPDWVFDNSLDNMGRIGSHIYYGPEWAQAGVGVMRYFKSLASEGGTRGPAIVHYPEGSKKGQISDAFSSVIDIAPTALQLAGISAPSTLKGRPVQELQGRSMLPLITGSADEVHPDSAAFGWEVFGSYGIRKGDWKLLYLASDNFTDPGLRGNVENSNFWGLYNMSTDPGEVNDVSADHPQIVADLMIEWEKYVARNNMVLPIVQAGGMAPPGR